MNFAKALKAKTTEERNKHIENEIYRGPWLNYLSDLMEMGGWPDDEQINKPTIDDSDPEYIVVQVEIEFVESEPTSCGKITNDTKRWATYEIRIDRIDGKADVECVESRSGGSHISSDYT